MSDEDNLAGLGGWLILVGVGLFASPIMIASSGLPLYLEIFSNGVWAAITTPSSQAYHPTFAIFLVIEIAVNCLLFCASIFLLYLFFAKKRIFPKIYISFLLFSVAYNVVGALAIKGMFPQVNLFDPATTKEFLRSVVALLIWAPYMTLSKRVKATFTN